MDEAPRQPSLALTASRYLTTTSIYSTTVSGVQRVAKASGSRWSIMFAPQTGALSLPVIVPGPVPPALANASTSPTPVQYTFRDAPSWVTGEWWANMTHPSAIVVSECTYLE